MNFNSVFKFAVAVFAVIFVINISMVLSGQSNISWGINGMTESRCIEGYKFIIDQHGTSRQILDEFGKGAKCFNNPDPGKMGSFGSNR
jgi:hypothetical protein